MERESTTDQFAVSEAESVDLLKRLGLAEAEIAELRQQGFIVHERRRGQSDVFKLRFRINGRQQVRYIGTSPMEAKRVELAVKTLQRAKRAQREMQKLQQESRAGLKATKRLLSPVLNSLLKKSGFVVCERRDQVASAVCENVILNFGKTG